MRRKQGIEKSGHPVIGKSENQSSPRTRGDAEKTFLQALRKPVFCEPSIISLAMAHTPKTPVSISSLWIVLIVIAFTGMSSGQAAPAQPSPKYPNYPSETPNELKPADATFDHVRREVMVPMRDGVKLHTVILVPRSATKAKPAAILLTRTPYSADELTTHAASSHLAPSLWGYDNATEVIVEGGYIRVVQDVRGKYESDGDYVMNRPLHGPQNPTPVDHSTDTYDTIDWLVKNVPECNGRVGIIGISYDGAHESHGGWLARRRLVPQRRVSRAEPAVYL
jgi:hypothetical protein